MVRYRWFQSHDFWLSVHLIVASRIPRALQRLLYADQSLKGDTRRALFAFPLVAFTGWPGEPRDSTKLPAHHVIDYVRYEVKRRKS